MVSGTWPFFSLMDDAMEGRLQGSAPILKVLPHNTDNSDFLQVPTPKRRKVSNTGVSSAVEMGEGWGEIEVLVNGDEDETAVAELEESEMLNGFIQEVDIGTDSEEMERENEPFLKQREKKHRDVAALHRERARLERERVTMERERAVIERERAVMERERAVMEREKLMLEKDREALHRERLALEKDKARWEIVFAQKDRTEAIAEDGSNVMNSDAAERKERFLSLLEKLVENI